MPSPVPRAAEPCGEIDAALAHLPALLKRRRETLVDRAIEVAKKYGYTRYTTTIRAAWIEAVDSLTDSLTGYLANTPDSFGRPEAETDYLRDPRFAVMRDVAKRHRAIGVTLQLYNGLFKHFRDLYLDILDDLSLEPQARAEARRRVLGFFDAAELSIGADWAEATEDDRLKELQARARSVALEKDRYFSVFESLRDPAFLLDRERRLINANQAAAEVFVGEASPGDIVYLRSMRTRRTSLEEVLLKASRDRKSGDRSVWLETQRGPRCFDLRERAIHDAVENTKLGHVVILHDVTPHRRATEEAERARRAMSSFLATMSHEIRTPLHAVLGATELLRDADSDRHPTYVDAIESAGRHLLQTLNKVLDYSKLEARPPEPTPQRWQLRAVFDEYGRFASVWARQAKTPLTMSIAQNLPHHALIDWEMTQQVLTNLVSNAIRHDGGGGVTISIRRRAKATNGKLLRFEVLDSGPGIAPACAETLFEPFGVVAPGAASSGGAGLGLAISRRLVEAMGGEIGFRNRARGTAFWFDLPYRAGGPPMADGACRPDRAAKPRRTRAGLRCLLVDDDPIGMMVTAEQLNRQGMRVARTESVAEAIAAAQETAFDVFVIDYYLADGDGRSLASELRRRKLGNKGARFIALTANADMITEARYDSHPFDAILSKPVAGDGLLAAIQASPASPPPKRSLAPTPGQSHTLSGVSPRIVDAMAVAFTAKWDGEAEKLQAVLSRGDAGRLADVAHRLASSCAVMGITDLANLLRDLEFECRHGAQEPDFAAWRARLDPKLRSAPKRARAIAAAAAP